MHLQTIQRIGKPNHDANVVSVEYYMCIRMQFVRPLSQKLINGVCHRRTLIKCCAAYLPIYKASSQRAAHASETCCVRTAKYLNSRSHTIVL